LKESLFPQTFWEMRGAFLRARQTGPSGFALCHMEKSGGPVDRLQNSEIVEGF